MPPDLSLVDFEDMWIATCLSTEPVDRAAAEVAVSVAYRGVGIEPPKEIIWTLSPAAGIRTAERIAKHSEKVWLRKEGDHFAAPLDLCEAMAIELWPIICQRMEQGGIEVFLDRGAQIVCEEFAARFMPNGWVSILVDSRPMGESGIIELAEQWVKAWAESHDDIRTAASGGLGSLFPPDHTRVQYTNMLHKDIMEWYDLFVVFIWKYTAHIWTNRWLTSKAADPWDNIGSVISKHFDAELETWCAPTSNTRHDAYDWAFFEYLAHICGTSLPERFLGLTEIAMNSDMFWAFRDTAVLTERPVRLSLDGAGRVHCDDRAAIEYRDGWGLRALHGTISGEDILAEPRE